jgi:hypothetical protein
MDRDELIRKIRGRIARCRELARFVNDPTAKQALQQMADEGEADLRRLEGGEPISAAFIDGVPHPKMTPPLN